jgi:SAM-dependent methyltransferase
MDSTAVIPDSLRTEEVRIREAYARRRSHPALYSRFDRAHLFMMQEREQYFLDLLARYGCNPLQEKKILEIGCGNGELLRDFIQWGATPNNVTGVELLAERVAEAIRLCPQPVNIFQDNAARLRFPDQTFDVVLQSMAFTSVLDDNTKRLMAAEMRRVVKPDGLILWYDYHINNPRNPDVKGVKLREIKALFPKWEIRMQRITLAPPIARRLAAYSWLIRYLLGRIPWLCTHYIGVIRKGGQ